ncbi:MAG: CoA-transferase [Armatimonadota bacterium]|nr:CoA-transferase [Armatimonadota bacterium]
MDSKIFTMTEAISRWVHDGASIVMGCGLESCIPFAAGHEIIRQGKRNLTLIGPISDSLFDQLIGAGCVRKVIVAWIGNVGGGPGYNFRRAVEQSIPLPLEVEDHTNLTIALGLQAAAWGVPYLPAKTALGTDLLARNPSLRLVQCPFTGEPLVAVRAIQPDVAIIHVQRADAAGNAHLWGNLGITLEAVRAAKRVIVSCEEVVDSAVIKGDPNRTIVPGFLVDAVVPEPWGAHPSPVQGYSRRDHAFYMDYYERSRTRENFERWLEEWVLGVKDRAEYLSRLGADRIRMLRPTKQLAPAVDYGW